MAYVQGMFSKQNLKTVYNTSNGIFPRHVRFLLAIVVDNVEFDMLLNLMCADVAAREQGVLKSLLRCIYIVKWYLCNGVYTGVPLMSVLM